MIKVLSRAKDIFITVIRPKSFSMTNLESISTLNPPTVVRPEATVAFPTLFTETSIASSFSRPNFLSSRYLSKSIMVISVPIPRINAPRVAVIGV